MLVFFAIILEHNLKSNFKPVKFKAQFIAAQAVNFAILINFLTLFEATMKTFARSSQHSFRMHRFCSHIIRYILYKFILFLQISIQKYRFTLYL